MVSVLLLCGLLQAVQDPSTPERWIEQLSSDSTQERDQALGRLVDLGEKALPALRNALQSPEQELRSRAQAAIAEIERLGRDRQVDLANKARLILASTQASPTTRKPPSILTGSMPEGARFEFLTSRFGDGVTVQVFVQNLLQESPEHDRRPGDVVFAVTSVSDSEGRQLGIDRCGECGPGLVHVGRTSGPVRVKIHGMQRWFSPHELVFPTPANGQRRQVGEFTIEVEWPTLRVRSTRPWPRKVLSLAGAEFTYDLKPGVQSNPVIFGGVGVGGGGGTRVRSSGKYWCHCPEGPQPVVEPPKPELVREFTAVHRSDGVHTLEQLSAIRYRFLRPIEEPFEFTCELPVD